GFIPLTGVQKIDQAISWLNTRLGTGSTDPDGVTALTEYLNYYQGLWPIEDPTATGLMTLGGGPDAASAAIITTDPRTGATVPPYIDMKSVEQARDWLQQQIGWESEIVGDWRLA